MRVFNGRRLSGDQEVVLSGSGGFDLPLQTCVVWHKRLGFRKHAMGLQFIDLTTEQSHGLVQFSSDVLTGSAAVKTRSRRRRRPKASRHWVALGTVMVLIGGLAVLAGHFGWPKVSRGVEGVALTIKQTKYIGLCGGLLCLLIGINR